VTATNAHDHNAAECREIIDLAKRVSEHAASDMSSLPRTAPRLAVVLAKKRSTTARWLWLSKTSVISHPKGTCRTSSQKTPTPMAATKRTTGGTSCPPAYRAEARLPPKTHLDSPRVQLSDRFIQE
jgi:hypothetical protein